MKADRLVATLLILQARGRVTAAELAEELEISERTARRDLESLAMAGVPVYSQSGRGGGWSLLGGARTDLSGLTAAEAQALFLVAGPQSQATPEIKQALRKLVRALPETMRADAMAASSAVVIDTAKWDQEAPKQPHFLDPLKQAIVDAVQVRLGYAGRDKEGSTRTVHPLGLVVKGSTWYFIANTDDGLRTFRVGRVTSVEPTDDPVMRPDGFDLEVYWRDTMTTLDEKRAPLVVRLRIDPNYLQWLRPQFGTRVTVTEDTHDGWPVAVVRAHNAYAIARELTMFGAGAEVLEPEEVRTEIARIGAELVDRYSQGMG